VSRTSDPVTTAAGRECPSRGRLRLCGPIPDSLPDGPRCTVEMEVPAKHTLPCLFSQGSPQLTCSGREPQRQFRLRGKSTRLHTLRRSRLCGKRPWGTPYRSGCWLGIRRVVAAVCFAEIGHNVVCVDTTRQGRRSALRDTLIHERHLPELLERHRNKKIRFTTDLAETTRGCEAIFIAVGTPQSETGDADLSYVEAVACEIARSLSSYKVIVEKTRCRCTRMSGSAGPMERNGVARELFDVVSNPEFLREGRRSRTFCTPTDCGGRGLGARGCLLGRSMRR